MTDAKREGARCVYQHPEFGICGHVEEGHIFGHAFRPAPAAPTHPYDPGCICQKCLNTAPAAPTPKEARAVNLNGCESGLPVRTKETRAEERAYRCPNCASGDGLICSECGFVAAFDRPPVREDAVEICRLCRHAKHRDCKVEGCACPVSPSLPERRREDAGETLSFTVKQGDPEQVAFDKLFDAKDVSEITHAHPDYCSQCIYSTAMDWFFKGWHSAKRLT